MTQLVMLYNNINPLTNASIVSGSPSQTNWSNLIMPPGTYQYNTPVYDLTAEGLYGIINVGVDGGWRIIYQSNVYQLMSGFAHLATYGRLDESNTNAGLNTIAKTNKLSLRCGPTDSWVRYNLAAQGITCRSISLLTAQTPNNYDDGHVVTEVYTGGGWKLWDVPSNRYYTDSFGNHLSLNDYFNKGAGIVPVYIAFSQADIKGYGSNLLSTNVIYDMKFVPESSMQAWIDRIYQIPGVLDTDGLTYFYMPTGTESSESWLLSLSTTYRVINYAAWLSKFYP